jgi:regulator of extracellular matrix RemA (YlzA/DUF370 family)
MDWQPINGTKKAAVAHQAIGWIAIGMAGFIQQSRIIGVSSVKTAPMRRLLQATPPAFIVVLTGGQRRQTIAVLDSGHVVITALTLADWQRILLGR